MTGVDAAIVIIENAAGEVLAVMRPGGDLGLPGGSIDPGETPEAAAIREVKEETSLDVVVRHLCTEPFHGHQVHVFLATSWSGTPRSSPEGEVTWSSWAEVSRGRYGAFNARLAQRIPRGAG